MLVNTFNKVIDSTKNPVSKQGEDTTQEEEETCP